MESTLTATPTETYHIVNRWGDQLTGNPYILHREKRAPVKNRSADFDLPIVQYTAIRSGNNYTKGEIVKTYDNVDRAYDALVEQDFPGAEPSAIVAVARGRRRSHMGFIWEFAKVDACEESNTTE